MGLFLCHNYLNYRAMSVTKLYPYNFQILYLVNADKFITSVNYCLIAAVYLVIIDLT